MKQPIKNILVSLLVITALLFQGYIPVSLALPVSGEIKPNLGLVDYSLKIDPERFVSAPYYPKPDPAILQTNVFQDFVNTVADGQTNIIRGIYSEGIFALPVVQQPSNQPVYVSDTDGVVTEFAMPRKYGVTGIVAHNYLAGGVFFELKVGDVVQVVYGDGATKEYIVADIRAYQALKPNSPHSEFIDLDSEERLSATQLFKRVYSGEHHLTLQTCIQVGEVDSWGRQFIIAEPA